MQPRFLCLLLEKQLFKEMMDQTPGAFIRRLRMELAFRSLQSRDESVLEVALATGFEDHSAFSRRFKIAFGYAPKAARQKINILSELECVVLEDPDIVELQDLEIQCVTEIGLYFESAPRAWEALKQKLNTDELSDEFSGLFIGIGHDNPHEGHVADDQVRFTAGIRLIERDLD